MGIDLSAFALIRALGDSVGVEPGTTPGAVLYCNIGDATNLAVAKGRSCLFTRVAPVGVETMLNGLCEKTGLTREHARMWIDHVGLTTPVESLAGDPAVLGATRGALETGISALQDELRLTLDYYKAQKGAVAIDRVVLGGPGSTVPGLNERLEQSTGLPFQAGRPAALGELAPGEAARLTLSYGLGLEN